MKRTVNQGEEGLVKNSFDFQETWQGHGKDMARTHVFFNLEVFCALVFFVWSCREEFSAGAARQVTNGVLLYHLFHAQSTALGLSSAYLPANQIQTRVDNEASSGQLLEYMIIYQ